MEPYPPAWEFTKEPCSCCETRGALLFCACPSCGDLVFICNKAGTVYQITAKRCGKQIEEEECFNCGAVAYSQFREAYPEEIADRGFDPQDIG